MDSYRSAGTHRVSDVEADGTVLAPVAGMSNWVRPLASGAVGAVALTLLHEFARRRIRYAPRMDVVAMRGLVRAVPPLRQRRVRSSELHRLALAGDLVANALYYSAIAAPTAAATWSRAAILGTAAGAGALLLPEPLGLGTPPDSHARRNQAMTIAWYVAGALTSAAVATWWPHGGRFRTEPPDGEVVF